MKVTRIHAQNILGLEEIEIHPGAITRVQGGNGVGKTSVVEAIISTFKGGHDATLLRKGATTGETCIVLDDGMEITRTVTPDKSPVVVKHPTFGTIAKPQGFLDKLVDSLSVNPLAFLAASPSKRAEALLEVLPSTVTDADLQAAGVAEIPPPSANGLQRIDIAKKTAYDERTGVNRTAKEKKATIAQIEASLPPDSGADPRAEEKAAANEALALGRQMSDAVDAIRKEEADRRKAVQDETNAAIRKLEEERTLKLTVIGQQATKRADEAMASYNPRIEMASQRATVARTNAERFVADQRSRAFIAEHREAVVALEENSATLTATLEKLDALRTAALAKLPIKGLEIRDGHVFVDDIPFDRVNRARQIRVALNIARLRAGQLGLVCIDGAEALDPDTLAQFEIAAEKSGLQFVISKTTSGPLTVTT